MKNSILKSITDVENAQFHRVDNGPERRGEAARTANNESLPSRGGDPWRMGHLPQRCSHSSRERKTRRIFRRPDNGGQITGPCPNSQNTQPPSSVVNRGRESTARRATVRPQTAAVFSFIGDRRSADFRFLRPRRGEGRLLLPLPLPRWEWKSPLSLGKVFRNIFFFPSFQDKEEVENNFGLIFDLRVQV